MPFQVGGRTTARSGPARRLNKRRSMYVTTVGRVILAPWRRKTLHSTPRRRYRHANARIYAYFEASVDIFLLHKELIVYLQY